MLQTCGYQKPQEDDSFELGDINVDIDEQFYVLTLMFYFNVWSSCLNAEPMLAATALLFNMFTCESVINYVI